MNLSQAGLDLIKGFEGFRSKAYKAVHSEKHYTIGYGHYGRDVKFGDTITKAKAEVLLKEDVEWAEKAVNTYVKVALNQNQYDALVSFTFNVGSGALATSTLLRKLNKKDYDGAAAEFPRWNKSGGKTLAGLIKRRAKEHDLFLKPVKKKAKTYKVKKGDTLSAIAKKYETTVNQLMKLNPSIEDADLIKVGQTIKLPS